MGVSLCWALKGHSFIPPSGNRPDELPALEGAHAQIGWIALFSAISRRVIRTAHGCRPPEEAQSSCRGAHGH